MVLADQAIVLPGTMAFSRGGEQLDLITEEMVDA